MPCAILNINDMSQNKAQSPLSFYSCFLMGSKVAHIVFLENSDSKVCALKPPMRPLKSLAALIDLPKILLSLFKIRFKFSFSSNSPFFKTYENNHDFILHPKSIWNIKLNLSEGPLGEIERMAFD